MPKLADTLVEGTVGQWLKQVGELVSQGEALASIETDKITTELPSPVAGTLLELLVPQGTTVAVETAIARIGEAVPAGATAPGQPGPVAQQPKPTPVAARLLAEHGLTPDQVTSRPGRLTKEEVISYIEVRRSRRDDSLIPLTPMRRAIAELMVHARQTIPHGQTVMDADLTALVAWRDLTKAAFQEVERANLSFTVCFVYALARALAADATGVDLGVAVALDAGLIVPVLRSADALSLGDTARGIADLAARARARTLTADDTVGARMTVTNVGSFGNLSAAPIVPVGQIAILGPGLVERRPVPSAGGGI